MNPKDQENLIRAFEEKVDTNLYDQEVGTHGERYISRDDSMIMAKDIDGDGKVDLIAADFNGDDKFEIAALDVNHDGVTDGYMVDTTGDGQANDLIQVEYTDDATTQLDNF